ncbi:MAG: LA_3751/LA_3752 family putative glycosyltransferase, partial [Sphaerospermopsis kisseleviana]
MNKLKTSLPLLIILSGVIFSLYLLTQLTDDLYFSGDGGLKALLAQQLSSGKLRFDLNLEVPQWVDNIWNQGLYPFEPPFSYKINNLYYITFPFTFPLLTAPFYAIFGYRGFYIIPLISAWIIWVNFYYLCQAFQMRKLITCIGLITLIFASPLTMYSAMYWEHTLAVCLAFSGLVIIFVNREKEFTNKAAILSGILIGLSVWFRPEFLALVAIVMMLLISSYLIKLDFLTLMKSHQIIFLASLILTILCFFALNKIIYNHPLGAHAFQVVEKFSLSERLLKSFKFFNILKDSLLKHFPIIYFAVAISVISIFKTSLRFKPAILQMLLISGLFLLIAPILIPSDGGKQWGPRFLLIIIPLINFVSISGLEKTWRIKQFKIKYISIAFLAMLFILGFNLNIIEGTQTVYEVGKTTNVSKEVLDFLRKDSNKFVTSPNQYVAQSFG